MGRASKRRESKLPRDDKMLARRRLRQRKLDSQELSEAELLREQGRARRQMIRNLIIVIVGVGLVAAIVIERFMMPVKGPAPPKVYVWDAAPTFTEEANPPAGSREVTDSGLAPLEGLAEGSVLARDAQVTIAEEQKWPVEIVNSIGMRFRLVPHGSFIMGSPANERHRGPDEPEQAVLIEQPFYMGKYEVTREQWELVMGIGSDPSKQKTGAEYPVEDVTWHMCQEFLDKLNAMEGLPDWAYRLPTEAEWEYACRAGTQTPYYFGSDQSRLKEFANYRYSTRIGKEAIGQRRPNAYGLYNMHGNVWEWCQDYFYYYDNPEIEDKLRRVLRGGHWRAEPGDCRSASRFRLPAESNSNLLGFRVVRSISKPPAQLPHKQPRPW